MVFDITEDGKKVGKGKQFTSMAMVVKVEGGTAEKAGFADGIRCATRKSLGEHVGVLERLEHELDDKLIFRKIRERFGGRLR